MFPDDISSIKPFQLGLGPTRSAFLKIPAVCHIRSILRSIFFNGTLLLRSFIGVKLVLARAQNFGLLIPLKFDGPFSQ